MSIMLFGVLLMALGLLSSAMLEKRMSDNTTAFAMSGVVTLLGFAIVIVYVVQLSLAYILL